MLFRKVYVEISNICNMNCSFCPGTRRAPGIMEPPEFEKILQRLRPYTEFLYFHLMGEPLCHPHLQQYLQLAGKMGFKVILTTNGTLLDRHEKMLLASPALHKVNISLHAFEANEGLRSFEEYIRSCVGFAVRSADKLVCLRLWNSGGADSLNAAIADELARSFPGPWVREPRGIRIGHRVYLEHGEKFDWPDLCAPDLGARCRCYGLKDQLGVLWDGTVVPCCLDHDGQLALGNLLQQELPQILDSPRARAIAEGFRRSTAVEELCRRCGYARRFRVK